MKMRRKGDLPEKICASCGRPFSWRRKWARDWENVRFCSQRCRGNGARPGAADGEEDRARDHGGR